jgi:hypothetical protein
VKQFEACAETAAKVTNKQTVSKVRLAALGPSKGNGVTIWKHTLHGEREKHLAPGTKKERKLLLSWETVGLGQTRRRRCEARCGAAAARSACVVLGRMKERKLVSERGEETPLARRRRGAGGGLLRVYAFFYDKVLVDVFAKAGLGAVRGRRPAAADSARDRTRPFSDSASPRNRAPRA